MANQGRVRLENVSEEQASKVKGVLLQFIKSGEIIAEAPLYVYDEEATWQMFLDSFGMIQGNLVGGFLNLMRIACSPEKRKEFGVQHMYKVETNPPVQIAHSLHEVGLGH